MFIRLKYIINYFWIILVFQIFLSEILYSKWEEGVPLPKAKSGTVATTINNDIYVLGGKGIIGTSPLSEIYDFKGKIWRPISIFPKEIQGFRIISFGKQIFLCGGFDGKNITNSCWVYDDILSNWSEAEPMPFARSEHVMVKIDHEVFVLGGVGESLDMMMSFNLLSRKWSYNSLNFNKLPYSSGFNSFNGKIAIVGGIDISRNKVTNIFLTYNPKISEWKRHKDYPLNISSSSVQQIGEKLHVVGGKSLNPNKTFDSHFSFFDGVWVSRKPLPTPRHDMSSALVKGNWFVIGGAISPGVFSLFSPTDVVEVYRER